VEYCDAASWPHKNGFRRDTILSRRRTAVQESTFCFSSNTAIACSVALLHLRYNRILKQLWSRLSERGKIFHFFCWIGEYHKQKVEWINCQRSSSRKFSAIWSRRRCSDSKQCAGSGAVSRSKMNRYGKRTTKSFLPLRKAKSHPQYVTRTAAAV
jgi:hypothetical protein